MKKIVFFSSILIVLGLVIFFVLSSLGLAHVSEDTKIKIFFSPFYGGFLAVTLLCLLCATPKKRARWSRITLWTLGLIFLLLQGGCWGAASGFGNATGGGVDNTWWHDIMAISVFVFAIWSFVIFLMANMK